MAEVVRGMRRVLLTQMRITELRNCHLCVRGARQHKQRANQKKQSQLQAGCRGNRRDFQRSFVHFRFRSCSAVASCRPALDKRASGTYLYVSHLIPMPNLQTAVLGGGCFWCLEAVFDKLQGVKSVESGYMGGTVRNPAYREVCEGSTGHAEVARITFDADDISFPELLEVFF